MNQNCVNKNLCTQANDTNLLTQFPVKYSDFNNDCHPSCGHDSYSDLLDSNNLSNIGHCNHINGPVMTRQHYQSYSNETNGNQTDLSINQGVYEGFGNSDLSYAIIPIILLLLLFLLSNYSSQLF